MHGKCYVYRGFVDTIESPHFNYRDFTACNKISVTVVHAKRKSANY